MAGRPRGPGGPRRPPSPLSRARVATSTVPARHLGYRPSLVVVYTPFVRLSSPCPPQDTIHPRCNMTDAKMPNGVTAAKRVSFESIGCKYRGKPKHLATVDFGTSHCSLAYLLNVDIIDDPANIDPVCVTFLCGPVHKSRVSTSALFDSDGDLVYFGESAIAMYKQFVKSGKEGYHFFHHIKSAFQRDKVRKCYHLCSCKMLMVLQQCSPSMITSRSSAQIDFSELCNSK